MTTKVTPSVLANTAITAGRYGGVDRVGAFTADAQGRIIEAVNTTIAITSTNLDTISGLGGASYGGTANTATHQVPVITIDTKGRITAAANLNITNTSIYANTGQLVANAATGVVQLGLSLSGVIAQSYGSGTTTPIITVDAYGRITGASTTLITGGSAGIGATTYNRQSFTATAGQTIFTVTSGYSVGYLQIYVNGVLLNAADLTASNGTSFTLGAAASVGDIVESFAYTVTLVNNVSPSYAGGQGGSAGVVLYQSAANTTSNTVVGTAGQVLTSAGAGKPIWTTLSATDITTGTLPTAQISGSYTGITGVGTLAAGSIPSSLITGLTVGSTANVQTFTTTGTWIKPTGCSMARIQVWGAGGGGARWTGVGDGEAGGGGGAYAELTVPLANLGATVTTTVGTGGTAAGNANGLAGAGGATSFAIATAFNGISTLIAYGGGPAHGVGGGGGGGGSKGVGGGGSNSGNLGYGGGPGSGATPATAQQESAGCATFLVVTPGLDGGGYGYGYIGSQNNPIPSAGVRGSVYGGGGGGRSAGTGGGSVFGGGGGNGGTSVYGGAGGVGANPGTAPGGGGGAVRATGTGAGAAGQITVTCW